MKKLNMLSLLLVAVMLLSVCVRTGTARRARTGTDTGTRCGRVNTRLACIRHLQRETTAM